MPATRPSHTRQSQRTDEDERPQVMEVGALKKMGRSYLFPSEKQNEEDKRNSVVWLRWANHFCFVERGKFKQIRLHHDRPPDGHIDMIALVGPVSGGVRKAARSLAGFTPLYAADTNPDVWELRYQVARVPVIWPLHRETNVILGHGFDGVWIEAEGKRASYYLQHADPTYSTTWRTMVTHWARRVQRNQPPERLIAFRPVELDKPRPPWMELWVIQMLRLENGYPRDVPGDAEPEPSAPAPGGILNDTFDHGNSPEGDVGADVGADMAGNAGSEADDDTASDAGSILDSANPDGLPNSHTWDRVTRTSIYSTLFPSGGPQAVEDPTEHVGEPQSETRIGTAGPSSPLFPPSDDESQPGENLAVVAPVVPSSPLFPESEEEGDEPNVPGPVVQPVRTHGLRMPTREEFLGRR
ncbi:hypothetical protein FRC06_009426 [Ceratobasidium sp. 370]|nr:hypothetical protein FRC06_009426 [Ceratobasidium sp. 370]